MAPLPTWQNWGKLQVKLEFSIQNWGKLQVKLEFCHMGSVSAAIMHVHVFQHWTDQLTLRRLLMEQCVISPVFTQMITDVLGQLMNSKYG